MPKEALIIVERGENQMRMAKRPGLIPGILVVTLLGFVVVWTPLSKNLNLLISKKGILNCFSQVLLNVDTDDCGVGNELT